jgi:hypothetical protein
LSYSGMAAGNKKAPMIQKITVWEEIAIRFEGRMVTGSYALFDEIVEVRTPHGSKATQLRNSSPFAIAKILLRELAMEGKA